jgi:lathosterol oxidase
MMGGATMLGLDVPRYALEYVAIFVQILLVSYLLPAGLFHWLYFRRPTPATEAVRIQARRPAAADIRRDIRHSLLAVLLFALYSLIVLQAYKAGATAVYSDFATYPWWWAAGGFVAATVLHDAYFYFTHRLMHLRPFFKVLHASHHRSITPTPWSILSFHPLETVLQFGFFALLIFLLPMHPAVLLAYLLFDGIVNAAGHCGHEVIPLAAREHRLLKNLNAVTHHDLHHSRFRYNFGQYFNFWDRLFGTFLDREAP